MSLAPEIYSNVKLTEYHNELSPGAPVAANLEPLPAGFAIRDLSVLSCAHKFTHWLYKCGDTPLEDTCRPGFFDAAGGMLNKGDLLTISGTDGVTQRAVVLTGNRVVTGPLATY